MLRFVKKKKEKRKWKVFLGNEQLVELSFKPNTITNKFKVVVETIEDMSNDIDEFGDWYSELLSKYIEDGYNAEIILDNTIKLLQYSIEYVDGKKVDFSEFVNISKSNKTSIMFYENDLRAISIVSTCLKLLSMYAYDEQIRINENVYKSIYEKLITPCVQLDTTTKIFQLVRSRIYRSAITDRYMWEWVKNAIFETPESFVMTIFNYVMTNILSIITIGRNPIPYIVSIIDDSIKWLMKSQYKDKFLYGESYGDSNDLYGSSLSKDAFYIYCCNDTIIKGAKIGMDLLEHEYNVTHDQFDEIRDRLDQINVLTPNIKLLIMPIISKILDIPYKYLLTCPPKHALLLGVFIHYISKDQFKNRFPIILKYMISCPNRTEQAFMSTRSSYKIRNLEFIINDENSNIFGFKSAVVKFDIMSSICGVLSASKKNLINLITGKRLTKITYLDLEHDITNFFTGLYSGSLNPLFEKLKDKADLYY